MPGPANAGFSAAPADTYNGAAAQRGEVTLDDVENVTFAGVGRRGMTAYGAAIETPKAADPPRGRWPQRRPADVAQPVNPVEHADRFAALADELAEKEAAGGEAFDVVHAHDWTTLAAGRRVADRLGVPLVAHVHSTEHDRAGDRADARILAAESAGLAAADAVVAVSEFTASVLRDRYGLENVRVVHNAADEDPRFAEGPAVRVEGPEKVVLFAGRLVPQKNPLGFIRAAALVAKEEPGVRFVVAGEGEQANEMRRLAAELGIGGQVLFAGFLRGGDIAKLYDAADAFVMPSASEPFGMVGVEAMRRGVPTIVSRQSGVAEAVENVVSVDFWDDQALADGIVKLLRDGEAARAMADRAAIEVRQMRWSDAAEAVDAVYAEVLDGAVDG